MNSQSLSGSESHVPHSSSTEPSHWPVQPHVSTHVPLQIPHESYDAFPPQLPKQSVSAVQLPLQSYPSSAAGVSQPQPKSLL